MAFLGMRGTGNWPANSIPESWREQILRLKPNGSTPLTGMLSLMKERKIKSYVHHWFTKTLPTQRATVTGIYVNATLTTTYVYATHQATIGIAGGTVYVKMSLADVQNFKPGHQVLLRDSDRYDVDIAGKVTSVVEAGASSYIAVKLLEADDNSGTPSTYNLTTVDLALIIGSMHPEGSERPESVMYDTVEFFNYTQIFRNAIELTRTAIETETRVGDPLDEARTEALELHMIEMEKAFFWSRRSSGTGNNKKPERSMLGIVPMIQTYNPTAVSDFSIDADYTGQSWLAGGKTWFQKKLELAFRYGRDEKIAFVGSGAVLGIQELAEAFGTISLKTRDTSYGIRVTEWVTPFGVLFLKRHPLFSYEASNRNSMVIFEPEQLTYTYLHDTQFHEDKLWKEGGGSGIDGPKEDYLTECTLEFGHPETFAYLNGVGVDSIL